MGGCVICTVVLFSNFCGCLVEIVGQFLGLLFSLWIGWVYRIAIPAYSLHLQYIT